MHPVRKIEREVLKLKNGGNKKVRVVLFKYDEKDRPLVQFIREFRIVDEDYHLSSLLKSGKLSAPLRREFIETIDDIIPDKFTFSVSSIDSEDR